MHADYLTIIIHTLRTITSIYNSSSSCPPTHHHHIIFASYIKKHVSTLSSSSILPFPHDSMLSSVFIHNKANPAAAPTAATRTSWFHALGAAAPVKVAGAAAAVVAWTCPSEICLTGAEVGA